jgi:hypothetical protein
MPDGYAIPGSVEDRENERRERKMAAEMKAADEPRTAPPAVMRIRPSR